MKIVIPAKGRASIIADKALRVLPDATLCVGEDEVQGKGTMRLVVKVVR